MFRRNIEETVKEAISHSKVVLINGPRQAGKTTLVRELIDFGENTVYVTFDDIATLSYSQRDPSGFIEQFHGTTIIDEVQRVYSGEDERRFRSNVNDPSAQQSWEVNYYFDCSR